MYVVRDRDREIFLRFYCITERYKNLFASADLTSCLLKYLLDRLADSVENESG